MTQLRVWQTMDASPPAAVEHNGGRPALGPEPHAYSSDGECCFGEGGVEGVMPNPHQQGRGAQPVSTGGNHPHGHLRSLPRPECRGTRGKNRENEAIVVRQRSYRLHSGNTDEP